MRFFPGFILLILSMALTAAHAASARAKIKSDAPPVTERFGFGGPEIFPIDPSFGQLRSGDIDGDGLEDIVVVNNTRSKINIHQRSASPR